jgi:soluble lytic murein transglycosylase-like protein
MKKCLAYYETFYRAGQAENLPPYFLMAIAARESACKPSATAFEIADIGEYAQGLMQILPSTYKAIGIGGNPYDPNASIWAAAIYFNRHLRPAGYQNAEQLTIGYRWGPGGARHKWGREHEQGYVQDVLFAWKIAPCILHPEYPPHQQYCTAAMR